MPRYRAAGAACLAMALTVTLGACSSKEEPKKKAAPTCPAGNPKPSRTVAWPTMYANVYNASDSKGEAATVARRLGWRGLNLLEVANDPLADDRPTPKYAEIRYGKSGRTIALNLATQIPHANLYQDERADPTVDVVIGNDFTLTPQPPRPIKDVKVAVFNTTFQSGLAATVSNQLAKQGFHSEAKANDRAYYPDDTAVIVYDEEGLPDAQRVQMSIPGSRLLQDEKANVSMTGRDVRLYLGSKWLKGGKVAPLSQATKAPGSSPRPSC